MPCTIPFHTSSLPSRLLLRKRLYLDRSLVNDSCASGGRLAQNAIQNASCMSRLTPMYNMQISKARLHDRGEE
jgi:hypothetical protein